MYSARFYLIDGDCSIGMVDALDSIKRAMAVEPLNLTIVFHLNIIVVNYIKD